MDWSKAKTILIIALLITNLVIGGFYIQAFRQESFALQSAAQSVTEYLAEEGVSITAQIPTKPLKLPVLFVNFENSGNAVEEYKGYPIAVSGANNAVATSASSGKVKGSVSSASSAILKTIKLNPKIMAITNIELVYWVDRSTYSQYGEDTAFPAWKIYTDKGEYYVEALE